MHLGQRSNIGGFDMFLAAKRLGTTQPAVHIIKQYVQKNSSNHHPAAGTSLPRRCGTISAEDSHAARRFTDRTGFVIGHFRA